MRRRLLCALAVLSALAAVTPATAADRAQKAARPCGSAGADWVGTYKDAKKGSTFAFLENGTATLTSRSGTTASFTFRPAEKAQDDWRARLSFAGNGRHLTDLVPQCSSRHAPGRVTRFDLFGRVDFERH